MDLAADLADHDLRFPDGQLEGLTAHHLNQDRQLQFATTLHLPGIRSFRGKDSNRDIPHQLNIQPRLQQPRRETLAGAAGERGGVDANGHRDRRLVHRDQWQRFRVVWIGERLPDGDLGNTSDSDDVAGTRRLRRLSIQGVSDQQLGESDGLDGAVGAAPGHILIASQGAGDDPAERKPSEVRRRVQVGDVCLQRRSCDVAGRWDVLQDRGKQRGEIGTVGHLAAARGGQRRATCFR